MSGSQSPRVGRDGFTGSPITVWCGNCRDWVVEHGKFCMWCEHPVTPPPPTLQRLALKREAEITARILRMSAEGRSIGTIAKAAHLSPRTVRNRLARIRAQLPTPVDPT